MTVVVAILGLIFLIVVHELGHMLTAKALGVRVTEFGVGFGPAVFKKKFGDTVYSLRIILLGGFAKMKGMEDIASVSREGGGHDADSYPAKAPWRRALIIFAGPFANLLAAVAILAVALMITGQITGVRPVVDGVQPDSMAAEVGVQKGDRLVALDGEKINTWDGFTDAVADRRPGDEVSLTVVRDGERRTFTGELGRNPDARRSPLVGVQPVIERTYPGPIEATGIAVRQLAVVTAALGGFVVELVTGEQNFYDNVTGPVGIASVGSMAVQGGFFLQLLAFISLNLAIFNLLPILPLDGGHLLFIALEKILGRPVSGETMGKVAALGVAMVLALFLFATYADLSKIIQGQPFIQE